MADHDTIPNTMPKDHLHPLNDPRLSHSRMTLKSKNGDLVSHLTETNPNILKDKIKQKGGSVPYNIEESKDKPIKSPMLNQPGSTLP